MSKTKRLAQASHGVHAALGDDAPTLHNDSSGCSWSLVLQEQQRAAGSWTPIKS